jgi:hypothetical protein
VAKTCNRNQRHATRVLTGEQLRSHAHSAKGPPVTTLSKSVRYRIISSYLSAFWFAGISLWLWCRLCFPVFIMFCSICLLEGGNPLRKDV